jgi:hypothetical protein
VTVLAPTLIRHPRLPVYFSQSEVTTWLIARGNLPGVTEEDPHAFDRAFTNLRAWLRRGGMPAPDAFTARGRPLWLESTLEGWAPAEGSPVESG